MSFTQVRINSFSGVFFYLYLFVSGDLLGFIIKADNSDQ